MPFGTPAAASSQPGALTRARSIPSLDGLRALAVGSVILSHFTGWSRFASPGPLHTVLLVLGQGGLGVNCFFIISGFLITTLLLEEQERTGTLNLRRFYFRRTLRIFPAYYVYLVVAILAARLAGHPIATNAWMSAAGYVSDYVPYAWAHPVVSGWYVAHTWSLSVEEQFYLLWPFLLTRLRRPVAIKTCAAVVCVTPLLRLLTVLHMPVYAVAEQWYRLFHTNADVLAMGCLMAFALNDGAILRRVLRWLHPAVLCLCVLFLAGSGYLLSHEPPWVSALVTLSVANAFLALLVLYCVQRPGTMLGTVLNCRFLRHLGILSYSLYLWQQMFLGPYNMPASGWNLLAIVACAELSYFLVEAPALRLRKRLEGRWFAREVRDRLPVGSW